MEISNSHNGTYYEERWYLSGAVSEKSMMGGLPLVKQSANAWGIKHNFLNPSYHSLMLGLVLLSTIMSKGTLSTSYTLLLRDYPFLHRKRPPDLFPVVKPQHGIRQLEIPPAPGDRPRGLHGDLLKSMLSLLPCTATWSTPAMQPPPIALHVPPLWLPATQPHTALSACMGLQSLVACTWWHRSGALRMSE